MRPAIFAVAAVALGTVLEPVVFAGSASWTPTRPTAFAVSVRAREYPTVRVGDTITIQFTTSNAEATCFKTLGGSRLVVRSCAAGGFHVYLRTYINKVAVSADTVTFANRYMGPITNACDSTLVALAFRGDTSRGPVAACDSLKH